MINWMVIFVEVMILCLMNDFKCIIFNKGIYMFVWRKLKVMIK